jgi:hypothetical protein
MVHRGRPLRLPPQVSGWVTPTPVRTGTELTYRSVVTDASALAHVQVQVGSGETLTLYSRNGHWERVYPGTLPQGVYALTFEAVDIAGNVGTGTSQLMVDNTPPTFCRVTLAGGPPYTYQPEVQAAVPGAIPPRFYGVGTGSITVTASISDDLAGLDTVSFPDAPGTGGVYPQAGASNVTMQHVYAFAASTTFSGTVSIQASDRAGNTVTSTVVLLHDTIAPTLQLNASSEGLTLSIAWSASDAEAGLNHCLLDLVEGNFTTKLSTACSGTLHHPGVQDAAYTVRLTAWDNVANRTVQEIGTTVASMTKY